MAGIDAPEFAAHIDERPARIAGVDRRIGLQEILKGGDAQYPTVPWR